MTLIDLDDVCVTNINRQLPADFNTIGQLKTEVLADRVRAINPACKVNIVDDFLDISERALSSFLEFHIACTYYTECLYIMKNVFFISR